jgi:hypothetical protein
MKARNLTKSRFKIGYVCPTKLFYQDDPAYGNNKNDDPFLKALAEGGFQVGELAKFYFPDGHDIATKNSDEAVAQTTELMKQKNVTIYEAAFRVDNLLVRADVVKKTGNSIMLYEVKAKSFDSQTHEGFEAKTGKPRILSGWEEYIVDVAFQKYVIAKAYPKLTVSANLMLADKSKAASVDGLNQNFLLRRDEDGRSSVVVRKELKAADLGEQILTSICVDSDCDIIYAMEFVGDRSFEEMVGTLSEVSAKKVFVKPEPGAHCKNCEFRIGEDLRDEGLKSGFNHCWQTAKGMTSKEVGQPFVFDIWKTQRAPKLLEKGVTLLAQVTMDDLTIKPGANGLSQSERQWLQVEQYQSKATKPFIDKAALRAEMKSWTYPFHFIDFETIRAVIPFHKGAKPYDQIAFQFSHHVLEKDGILRHANQFLNLKRGYFPNFDFVRELRRSVGDKGSIFCYSQHENNVLRDIGRQLAETEQEVPDRKELIEFIDSVTTSKKNEHYGEREMVDLLDLVLRYYMHPAMKNSNSIKRVLPAVLSDSEFLKKKYSQPIYGTKTCPSLNFKDKAWIKVRADGKASDPYAELDPVFKDVDTESILLLLDEDSLADGGAAMTAYARMQFTEMSDLEVTKISEALLRYCELDTLAMVMIYEYWRDECKE